MFRQKKNKDFKSVFTILFIILLFAVEAGAQDDDLFMLEEITVTAEKKETNLQKTPLSVIAVTGASIREMGLISMDEVLKDVPGVVVQGAARGYQLAIRGLGSDLPPSTGESSVSTNFDGVYNFRAEAGTIGYYDLDRVEVLRGPQGTLYGRNATGGVVNLVSKKPSDEFEGYGTVEIGSYDMLRTEGAVNVPVNDELAVRMAYVNINRDGFLTNGQNDAVGSSARAKILYEASDDFSIMLQSEYTKIGGKGIGFVNPDDFNSGEEYLNDKSEYQSQNYKSSKFSAVIDVKAGPGVLTIIPSYQHGEGIDFSEKSHGGLMKSWDPEDANQYSTELRYASEADARVQWVGGLYYYKLRNERSSDGGMYPLYTYLEQTTAYAAFGQVTYPFTNKIRGTVGLRAAIDEKAYEIIELVPSNRVEDDWNSVDLKAGLEFDLSRSVLGYITVATGHRPGGFNDQTGDVFEPEELMSTEIGVKSRFMENRIQVNADAFYYDYQDYQYSDHWWEGDILAGGFFNAGDAKNYGLELETQTLIGDSTLLDISAIYLHARFDCDLILHEGDVGVNMNGKALPHAPDLTFNASIEHGFPMRNGGIITPKFAFRWMDDQYIAPFPGAAQLQEAYAKYDASLLYNPSSDLWSLNLYIKNISDEIVKTGGGSDDLLVGTPRQYGVVFSAKF